MMAIFVEATVCTDILLNCSAVPAQLIVVAVLTLCWTVVNESILCDITVIIKYNTLYIRSSSRGVVLWRSFRHARQRDMKSIRVYRRRRLPMQWCFSKRKARYSLRSSGVARICCKEGQRWKSCHGELTVDFRAGCSSGLMTRFVTNAVRIERAVSCWHLHQLISQTTQYLYIVSSQIYSKVN